MAVQVVVVEQSEIVRRGILSILHESGLFAEVKEQVCGSSLQETIKRFRPGVLIINPSMTGCELREHISATGYQPKIIALVYGIHDESLLSAYDDIIMISETRQKIIKKLQKLINHGQTSASQLASQLSSRETDVLKLLVQGMSNKEISNKLFISTHTVISHRKNITQKLNIRSVAGLTVYAILNGVSSMEDFK